MYRSVIVILAVLLSGCGHRLYLSSDYDRQTDFSQYATYTWAPEQERPGKGYPMYDNELNRQRVRSAIDWEMQRLGFEHVHDEPDLLVDFHITIEDRTHTMTHDYYPFEYRYWPQYDITTYSVRRGSLIIHLVDRQKGQLVWQGLGSRIMDDVPPANMEKRINSAVRNILNQYMKN